MSRRATCDKLQLASCGVKPLLLTRLPACQHHHSQGCPQVAEIEKIFSTLRLWCSRRRRWASMGTVVGRRLIAPRIMPHRQHLGDEGSR
jgi:hypothetical protein